MLIYVTNNSVKQTALNMLKYSVKKVKVSAFSLSNRLCADVNAPENIYLQQKAAIYRLLFDILLVVVFTVIAHNDIRNVMKH